MKHFLVLLFALGLARSQDVPTLYLIGDSTVRNGKGDGSNGQWGWGDRIAPFFSIKVENRALGGRSSRTYITGGQWEHVREALKPGDFVLMQFGHNDGSPLDDAARARGTLPGIGDETKEIDNPITMKHEVVHTYGWYMRQFLSEAKAKGAVPMICSPVPRNNFKDGKVSRSQYQGWAKELASAEHVPFLDIAEMISMEYEGLGPEKVAALFHGDHTHTSMEGAEINAAAVVKAIRASAGNPLIQYLKDEPPTSWIDAETGHRVIRLTREPGSASLYFNQNGYTADGKNLVYTTPQGISVLDLQTQQARQVVAGRVRLIDAGRKNRRVYYIKEGAAWWSDIDSGEAHKIGGLPPRGSIATVNADETLLAGTYVEGAGTDPSAANRNEQGHPLEQPLSKGQMMEQRWAAKLPMAMYTMNVATGETKVIHRATDWLNHLLFSPTDPHMLMFCHEGPWHKVDRIWTVQTDTGKITKIHTRTMAMEIFGHEFWSADGKTIWYDLQTPRGEDFWVAGYRLDTGARTWYHLQRNEWSIHFNVTRDGKLFCGDGGDPGQVAKAPDGEWIYLFHPKLIDNHGASSDNFVQPGAFRSERLVRMAKHNYRLEPNVSFSPDQKYVIFRSNMFGPTYVFAVEVAKTEAGH